jgi:NADPH:quinone reductase-like Zn-dependent oxidoreductase
MVIIVAGDSCGAGGTMKAAVMASADATPAYQDVPDPEPGEGWELVDLVAAAIHPVARSQARGEHYTSSGKWPLIPGIDAVARTRAGTLVYVASLDPSHGTFAEHVPVPAGRHPPLPPGADPVAVAAGINPGMASWVPLKSHVAEHATPHAVAVLGATGMAGGLAVQNALALGASRIIAIGRGATDLERVAALGADTVALTGDSDKDTAAIADAFTPRAPDLVLDFLWGTPAACTFQALQQAQPSRYTGYVQIGSIAGSQASVPAALLRSRPFRITGSGFGSFTMADYTAQIPAFMQFIADGKVQVRAEPFPLSRVADAWAAHGARAVLVTR